MELAVVSFIAGILTILAPCVLPVLPIIIGGSAVSDKSSKLRAVVIVASLAFSIFAFTLLLKATTALLGVPQIVWQIVSASILIVLGVAFIFPQLWDRVALSSGGALASQKLFGRSTSRKGLLGAAFIGAALGPVFSSCSPTYAFIVAAVLPVDLATGLLYLLLYVVGLAVSLLAVSLLGQAVIKRLGWALNPHGVFRKVIGVLFILIGLAVLFGIDKQLQATILENGLYEPIERIEMSLPH